MSGKIGPRTGGRVLVDALVVNGIDTVFCVAGESYLPVLDSLYESRNAVRLISCRQEGAACHMAEAWGKLTGKPGICFVSRGPGTMNATIGVHTAQQDSTPLILFIGQVARGTLGREALQEIDYTRLFPAITKWCVEVDDARRLPEIVGRAFQVATSGRPGPVVISLPEDVLDDVVSVADPRPFAPVRAHPGASDLERLVALLSAARQPLAILGGGGWNQAAADGVGEFLRANRLPVAVSFRRHHLFDNRDPRFVGDVGLGIDPRLAQRVRDADLLLVIGAELGEVVTGRYTYLEVPTPRQTLVHVHPGPEELGKVYQPTLAINAGMPEFAAAVAALPPVPERAWDDWTRAARAEYEDALKPVPDPGPVQLGEIVAWLNGRLPEDAIVTNGGGTYTLWLLRHFQFKGFNAQLSPASGSMGYGLPAALAGKIVHPERTVVAFAGDGCFLMTGQELATAVQHRLPVVVILVNNDMLGSIRLHQERRYPDRVSGTDLVNPDFVAFARSFGIHATRVDETAAFPPAFEAALAAGGPALIEVVMSPEAMGPGRTLSAARGAEKRVPDSQKG